MTFTRFAQASVCATALMSATGAQADVTAAEIWTEWQNMMEVYGENALSFSGGNTVGGTLTAEDVTFSVEAEDVNVNAEIGTIVFEELGDGTVRITMDDSYPMTITGEDGTDVTMTVTQSGMEIIASGEPGMTNYDVVADRYGIVLDEFTDEDGVTGDIRVMANGLTGAYSVEGTGTQEIDYTLAAASLDLLFDIDDPNNGSTVVFSGQMNDFSASAEVQMPEGMDMSDPENLFANGFGTNGAYSFSSANYIFDFAEDGETVQGTFSSGAGSLGGTMDKAAIAYQSTVENLAVNAVSNALPLPIDMSLDKYDLGFSMPLSKSDDPQDFGLLISILNLAVNDELWMMADPAGALPHDPITLLIDLTGQARLFFDITDPEEAEAMAFAGAPGELLSLSLNDLTLLALGAEVTGTGAFTFDNSDMQTFDGLPRPEGDVTINIKGANALIDQLVAMGLVPEDQAMMGRMMMGMFARTVGDDELTSTIEVNEQGHVIANGQRIQ